MLETMTRAIPVILSVTLIILAGCGGDGDEDQGIQNPLVVPNPLQIEISMVGEENEVAEESSPVGSITGRIIFTDNDGQIQAYPLASYEYVIPEGSSNKVSGKNLILCVAEPILHDSKYSHWPYFVHTSVAQCCVKAGNGCCLLFPVRFFRVITSELTCAHAPDRQV